TSDFEFQSKARAIRDTSMRHWLRKRARSWRTWAVLLFIAALAALAAVWLWTEGHLCAARRALGHHAYRQAQSHLDRYLRVWPDSEAAHLLLGRCARLSGDFSEAEHQLDQCDRLGLDRSVLALE